MATNREPQVTSRLQSVTSICKLDVLRVLIRMDLGHSDQVAVLTTLMHALERLRDDAAAKAVSDEGASYAELGRRMGVSRSYAARLLKPMCEADD